MKKKVSLQQEFDRLYIKYNNKNYIKYDPIKYVYQFQEDTEREVVALLASSLSFGRVTQIFKAMDRLLDIFHGEPLNYIKNLNNKPDKKLLTFKYRFVDGRDVFNLLQSLQKLLRENESLGDFARANYNDVGLFGLADLIIDVFKDVKYLIPCALKGSPCKRLFMFFRWMVRKDNVDLGLWNFINPGDLVIPLDTHIFQVSTRLNLTCRKSPSFNSAIEITDNLKKYSRNDPVKYDWALSHIGIIKNNFSDENEVEKLDFLCDSN